MNEKTLTFCLKKYEEKLAELMDDPEYQSFVSQVAVEAFRFELEGMPDGDFKDFCYKYFDVITR